MSDMECKIIMEWTDYLPIGIFQAVVTLAVWFLASYIKEKGKNLATREDIQEITDKIESVKTEYAKELEGLKSQLNAKFHAHTVRFEKEFQVLEEVWSRLIDLHSAGAAFQPGLKSGKSDKAEDMKRFGEAYNAFLRTTDVHKPFFPQEVFNLLEDYRRGQFKYVSDHEFITQPGFQRDWVSPEFWDKRDENLKEITKLVDAVCDAIRNRMPEGGGMRDTR
jgi:hypothetical protein